MEGLVVVAFGFELRYFRFRAT